jgi:AraC-like DNA-binding protein
MDYAAFASDLPSERIVFRSAEENEETMRRMGVRQEVRQLGRGRFRCDMAVCSTMGAELFSDRFNLPFAARLEPPTGSVALLIPRSPRGGMRVSGQQVGNDSLVYLADGSGVDIVTRGLAGSEAITIPSGWFEELSQTLYLVELKRSGTVQGDPRTLQALKSAILHLMARPDAEPREERLSNLLAGAVSWLGDALAPGENGHRSGGSGRSFIARQARDFIEANHHEAIRLVDLSRVTGVGVRTLQRAFREYFALSISDYLKMIRLAAAHRDLAAADPSQESVTAIALRRGFTHLGRFSVEFRDRFGESPGETLRRKRTGPLPD